ncbi:MAG: TCP-1/cpn60 chaperonin family protein [Candidatus Bathyarchaeia archaeon]
MRRTSLTSGLSPNYDYVKGKEVWRSNLRTVASAARHVRTSLGPNGAYKMVALRRGPERIIKITRDAAVVLDEFAIQYPTTAFLAEAAKLQRQEVGDGVTSFIILTAALLEKADQLVARGVHPTVIVEGFAEAERRAIRIIDDMATRLDAQISDAVLEAVDCGRNLLTEKLRHIVKEACQAAAEGGKVDRSRFRYVRVIGGGVSETRLIRGVVLKKQKLHPNMPDHVEKPRIALTCARIGSNRLEIKMPTEGSFHMKLELNRPEEMAACRDAENRLKDEELQKLSGLDVNLLFCQQPIDEHAKNGLCRAGTLAFETIDRTEMAIIAKATGATIVSSLAELKANDVGNAESLETEKLGLEKAAVLLCPGYATFMLRGSTAQGMDEMEQILRNAVTVLETAQQGGWVAGGGAIEMHLAQKLRTFARQVSGRQQLAIDGFAEALLEIPWCLAENNGLNSLDILARLSQLHADGGSNWGVGLGGCQEDVCQDSSEVKKAVIRRACEVASLLLRIDEQVTSREMVRFRKQLPLESRD